MLLSQLYLNNMFMRFMEAIDRRKNCCLNEGFVNSLNKIQALKVNVAVRHLSCEFK